MQTKFNVVADSVVQSSSTIESYQDFNITNGFFFLWCCTPPIYALICPCCAYARMSTQEVFIDGNRLHFKYDCLVIKEDKLIPLDRIQDINIETNICARICGVSLVNIQTANGNFIISAIFFF